MIWRTLFTPTLKNAAYGMDSWPCRSRKDGPNAMKKQKAIESCSYPLVAHGAPNFVTLVEKDGRFQWTSVFKDGEPCKLRAGKSHVAFPPTCPQRLVMPHLSVGRRAVQGANFIRTYHPDVDVPSELIREQLMEAVEYTDGLRDSDPHAGSLLESVLASDSHNRMHA